MMPSGVVGRGRGEEFKRVKHLVRAPQSDTCLLSVHPDRPELRCRSGTEGLPGRTVLYYLLQWGTLQGFEGGSWGPCVVP